MLSTMFIRDLLLTENIKAYVSYFYRELSFFSSETGIIYFTYLKKINCRYIY